MPTHQVFHVDVDGPLLRSERDATDLIAETYGVRADWVAIPLERLAPDFFDLKNGVAGAFIQKLVNYDRRVVFVGDIAARIAASEALAAYVRECKRGGAVRFVTSFADLL